MPIPLFLGLSAAQNIINSYVRKQVNNQHKKRRIYEYYFNPWMHHRNLRPQTNNVEQDIL